MWKLCHSKVRWWAVVQPTPTIPTLPAIPPTHLVLPHLMPMEVVEHPCPHRPSQWQRHGHSWRWCSCHVVMPRCHQKFDSVSSRRQPRSRRKLSSWKGGEGNFDWFCESCGWCTSHNFTQICSVAILVGGRQRKQIIGRFRRSGCNL